MNKQDQRTLGHLANDSLRQAQKNRQEQVVDVDDNQIPQSGLSNMNQVTFNQPMNNPQNQNTNNFQERVEKEKVKQTNVILKCGRFQLTRKHIIIIAICIILVLCAIAIPLAVIFRTKKIIIYDDGPFYHYPIRIGQKQMVIVSSSIPSPDNIAYTLANRIGSKTDATEPYTQVTARCDQESDVKQNRCSVIVPVLSILSFNDWDGFEENRNNWLDEYNKNPRQFTDRLVSTIKNIIQTQNSEDKDKLILLEIEEESLIDVIYNQEKQIFELARFDLSKGEYIEQKPAVKSEPSSLDWVEKVLQRTSKKLKDIIQVNLNVIKTKSTQIIKQQQKFVEDEKIQEKWQQSLVNKCRIITQGVFRCSFEAAEDLIPGFEGSKDPTKISDDVILTYALELRIKDIKI